MAPKPLAAPIAERPATPAPITSTFAGSISNLGTATSGLAIARDGSKAYVSSYGSANLAILSNAAGGSLQFPAVISRTFADAAGTQTVYLNGMLAAGAGVANCQTNITAFFTPAALP